MFSHAGVSACFVASKAAPHILIYTQRKHTLKNQGLALTLFAHNLTR